MTTTTTTQDAKRLRWAQTVCLGAGTAAAWAIAQRLVKSWGCDCETWAKQPKESVEAERLRSRSRQHS